MRHADIHQLQSPPAGVSHISEVRSIWGAGGLRGWELVLGAGALVLELGRDLELELRAWAQTNLGAGQPRGIPWRRP